MKKIYECFCGEIFDNGNKYHNHSINCEMYQSFKKIYLTETNFHYLYMIRRQPIHIIFSQYPYNQFCYADKDELVRKCNFEPLIKVKSGKRYTKKEINSILNYEYLYDRYINKKMDCVDIAKELKNNFAVGGILLRLDELGIPKRSRSEVTKMSIPKMQEGCLKSIGVLNPSFSKECLDKKPITTMKNFGVTHHFKLKSKVTEMQDHIEDTYGHGIRNASSIPGVQDKKDKSCFEHTGFENTFENVPYIKECITKKIGVDNYSKLASIKKKKSDKQQKTTENGVKYSKQSVDLFNQICKQFDSSVSDIFRYATHGGEDSFIDDFWFCSLDFSYDMNGIKFAIEYNGDLWHANPAIYKEDDHPNFENPNLTSKDIWLRDKQRNEVIIKNGYKLLTVWEYDFLHDKEKILNECVSFIKNCLTNNH